MKADSTRIDDLFTTHFFKIPPYQRPYVWSEQQIEKLITDIQHAQEKRICQYFLGSIVLIEDENERCLHNVVDGQQRIISLTIIFSVLRFLFTDQQFVDKTHDVIFRKEDKLADIKGGYRVRGVREEGFFEKYIQSQGMLDNIKRFTASEPSAVIERYQLNTRHALKALQKIAKKPEELQKFARWLFSECVLIVISTKNTKSAFQIFNSLNGRGTPLSHIDVLKSEILAAFPSSQDCASNGAKWDHYEDSLGPKNFKKLFEYIYMIKSCKKVEEDTFASDFKEVVNPHADPLNFFNHTFLHYAKAYEMVLNSDISKLDKSGNNDEVNKLLWLLTRNKDCIDHITPCIVAYLIQRPSVEDLKEFLWRMERRWAYHLVKKTGYKEQQDFSFEIIKAILSAQGKYEPLYHVLDTEFQIADNKRDKGWKDELKKQIHKPVYKSADIAVSKYLLLRVNSELPHEPGTWRVDDNKLTIEHILPQTLSEEWKKKWSHQGSVQAHVHKLGNLALLTRSINSTVRNASFQTKKAQFLKDKKNKKISALPITVELQQYNDWTKTEFDKRQSDFCVLLENVWKLNGVATNLTSSAKKRNVPHVEVRNKENNTNVVQFPSIQENEMLQGNNRNNKTNNNNVIDLEKRSLKRKREDDLVTDECAQSEPATKKQKLPKPSDLGRTFRLFPEPQQAPEEVEIEVVDDIPSSPSPRRVRKTYPRRSVKDLVNAGLLAVGDIVSVKSQPEITATIDINGLIDGYELKEWLELVTDSSERMWEQAIVNGTSLDARRKALNKREG